MYLTPLNIRVRIYVKLIIPAIYILMNSSCMASTNQLKSVVSEQKQEEFTIEKDLGKAVISWLTDGNEPAALECDRLVDSLLSTQQPTARAYFIAAQIANLRQNYKKAMNVLELAIEKYPDEKAPIGINVPIKIVGRLWISNFAKQSGDIELAKKIYEDTLKILSGTKTTNGIKDKSGLIMICYLYLAELESEHLENNQQALTHLQMISDVNKPTDSSVTALNLYISWSTYKSTKIAGNKENSNLGLSQVSESMYAEILAVQHLILNGIAGEPLVGSRKGMNIVMDLLINRTIESESSLIDKDLACLGYGYDQQYKGNLDKAEQCYTQLFQNDSFFSPVAGLSLARVRKAQGKVAEANDVLDQVSKKYPGYESVVKQTRQSLQ